jgi:pyruvate/2-oxoglutarate dehydrogenase complex dihydrolipoamide acyltransferase (E2) component
VLAQVLAPGPAAPQRLRASPKARRLARERGIDLADVDATGGDGIVVAADLPAAATGEWQGRIVRERKGLSVGRRRVARHTTQAWTVPHFVQMLDVDVTVLHELRDRWKRKGGPLASVTWTALFVSALARSLALSPDLNAAVDGDDLVLFDGVHIGIAVERDSDLVVPVIANADRLALTELAATIARATGSGDGDAVAASATVSNLGAHGIKAGTPVLNSPEAVLLFAGAVEDRPVVRDGKVDIRTMCTLSVAFDHRVTDGAPAARFCAALRDRLEQPDRYL